MALCRDGGGGVRYKGRGGNNQTGVVEVRVEARGRHDSSGRKREGSEARPGVRGGMRGMIKISA